MVWNHLTQASKSDVFPDISNSCLLMYDTFTAYVIKTGGIEVGLFSYFNCRNFLS